MAYAQNESEQVLRIRQFGGLNTIAGDFSMKPSDARIAHNIDFSKNVGSISKRDGYDSVSTITGQDSAIGLYGHYYSDGTQRLIFVTDSADVGYGNVYASSKGQASFQGLQVFRFIIDTTLPTTLYVDTFVFVDTTVILEYTTSGDAFFFEVATNMVLGLRADSLLNARLSVTIFGTFIGYTVVNATFTELSVSSDTNQTITEITDENLRIKTYWPIFSKPSFTTLDDKLYMSNGDARGLVWNDSAVHSFP
jgi:hypothetical protein